MRQAGLAWHGPLLRSLSWREACPPATDVDRLASNWVASRSTSVAGVLPHFGVHGRLRAENTQVVPPQRFWYYSGFRLAGVFVPVGAGPSPSLTPKGPRCFQFAFGDSPEQVRPVFLFHGQP